MVGTPADFGMRHEELTIRASDGTELHGWFVPAGRGPTLLWLHGNAGNISHRLPLCRALHERLDAPIVMLGYRGYGRSSGVPNEAGLYLDAAAALELVESELAGEVGDRVVLLGQSLGGAVATDLAVERPVAGLILESTFTSLPAMARLHYPWLPVGALVRSRYDSLAKVARLPCPLLVVHGDRDEIVPVEMGRAIYEAAPEPKRLLIVPGAGHNDVDLAGGAAYFDALGEFLAEARGSA